MGARKFKIMKGDRVRVIRGNYRDMEGTVLEVQTDKGRVRVEGVNMRKRHKRPSQANPDGGIVTFEAPIHVSNVMLIDPAAGEPGRVRMRIEEDGTKERISVKTGNPDSAASVRRGRQTMEPRLKKHYDTHVRAEAPGGVRFRQPRTGSPGSRRSCSTSGSVRRRRTRSSWRASWTSSASSRARRPMVNRARKSISNFSLREGMPVGVSVTLRQDKMWFFLDRLISTAIPRIRDFRGLQHRARSTAVATTPWASRSRSSSPRSTTTR